MQSLRREPGRMTAPAYFKNTEKTMNYDNWKLETPPEGRPFTLASGKFCKVCGEEIPATQIIECRGEKFIPMVGSDYNLRVYFYQCKKCKNAYNKMINP